MQRIDFFRLARPIQERFVAAAQGVSPPLPLAVQRPSLPRSVLAFAALAALSLLAMGGVWTVGYGKLASPLALQGVSLAGVYALLGGVAGLAAALARLQLKRGNKYPFARAVFLFPSGVVDATGSELAVRPLADLGGVTPAGTRLELAFVDGGRFSFQTASAERAAELANSVNELRARLSGEIAPVSSRDVAALDPLSDTGFSNPFSPRESMVPPPRRLAAGGSLLLGAALVGAGIGAGVWKVRNTLGERALYRAARAAHTYDAYRAYVDRGGSNPDVKDVLLPRTELAEVAKRHDVAVLEKFADEHKGSRIEPEIQALLHQELLAALTSAKATGSLRALKEFRARFRERPSITADVDRAIAERLTAALADFNKRAQPRPSIYEIYRRLLNYASQNEGKVEVRFRRRIPESVARAETLLQKSNYFGGKASLPGQYFDAAHAAKREEPVAQELVRTLQLGLPEDIIKFEAGPPIPDGPEEDPKVNVPTLVITHRTEMSGAYLMKRPRAALTGVGVLFRIAFQLPNDAQIHNYKFSTWAAPDLKSMMDGRSFEEIYGEMGDKSFSKLAKKYLSDTVPGLAKQAG